MRELIKIDNSNLQLEELTVPEFRELKSIPKSDCKFLSKEKPLFVLVKNSGNVKYPVYYVVAPCDVVNEPKNARYWVFYEGDQVEEVFNYSREETTILCGLIEAISNMIITSSFSTRDNWYTILSTLEKLCRATKIKHIIQGFYKTIGWRRRFLELVTPVDTILVVKPEDWKTDAINQNRFIYQAGKDYDVLDLINDLLADNAYINLDESRNALDEYTRMSAYYDIPSTAIPKVRPVEDQWCKVTGKVGNSTRANISLTYKLEVDVDIPENNFGISSPLRATTVRNFCIIKDGYLWKRLLPAKISQTLRDKLEGVMTVFDGEDDDVILDLSSIPVVKESSILGYNTETLGRNHFKQILADTRIYFLRFLYPEKKDSQTFTPGSKEEFLAKLGIVNGFYTYVSTKENSEFGNKKIELFNSIQFSAKMVPNTSTMTTYNNPKGIAATAFKDYNRNSGNFTSPSSPISKIYKPVLKRVQAGEDPEEIIKELKEESSACKKDRMDLKVIQYHLLGSAEFPGNNLSAVHKFKNGICKDTIIPGIIVKATFGSAEVPYTSYKW